MGLEMQIHALASVAWLFFVCLLCSRFCFGITFKESSGRIWDLSAPMHAGRLMGCVFRKKPSLRKGEVFIKGWAT